jgi:hypothetical protein
MISCPPRDYTLTLRGFIPSAFTPGLSYNDKVPLLLPRFILDDRATTLTLSRVAPPAEVGKKKEKEREEEGPLAAEKPATKRARRDPKVYSKRY